MRVFGVVEFESLVLGEGVQTWWNSTPMITGLKWNVYLGLGRIRGWSLKSFIWWFNGSAWQNVKGIVRAASSFRRISVAATALA